jgi:microsomal dipeptidase-like Zn-dependent dipeptidase
VVADAGGVWTKLADSRREFVEGIEAMVDAVGIDHAGIGSDTDLLPSPEGPRHQQGQCRRDSRILSRGGGRNAAPGLHA